MNGPTIRQSYFERLQELFDQLSELSPEEREREIRRVESDSPQLSEDLRALLGHAARADSPLDSTVVSLADESEPPPPEIPGFRIHRSIGSGGSATVYLADQEHAEFTRTVALKVVDRLVDEESLRSVREEQRILARLEHPGIARLYDSGMTPTGQPWLAMEHVEGESILAHCDRRKLSVRERIELFLPVLDAVAYAHARGIVHRDLKPANIFVTAGGEPRLLDFGIARLSDPTDQDETRTLRRALTPAYASPEQMRGGRTTTATDIYSLGVVLHELLTGSLPHETEPRRQLGADIDAVLEKALHERPEERHASATAMAKELRRVLSGTPRLLRRLRIAGVAILVLALIAAVWQVASRWREKQFGKELAIYRNTNGSLREGVERLARFDASGARDAFRRAAVSSKGRLPDEALAWDGLARAESFLGETGRAADAALRANALVTDHADTLPRLEAERLRARALAANRKWSAAITALEGLFGAQPERVDLGIDLVNVLLACGRTDAADTALGRLRQIAPQNSAGDPRIDLVEAELAMQLSEYQRCAAAASRAHDRAVKLHAVALGQRAARFQAEAIGRLDRREESSRQLAVIASRDQALGMIGEAGNARLSLATVMVQYAGREETRRELSAAHTACLQAGDRRCEIMSRTLLAMLDGMEGKFNDATRAANTALADARAIGDRWCEGYVLSQLQVLYNWADEPAAIKAITEPTLAALRDSGNRRLLLTTLSNVALVAVEDLELEKAEAYIVEAEELARRVGVQVASAGTSRVRGYLEQTRGDLDLARESYTSALNRARQAGVPWNIANYLYDLAWLDVDADRPDLAAQHAKESMETFLAVGDVHMARSAEGALAWSEARQGHGEAAKRRLAAIQRAAVDDRSETGRFTLLDIEAHVAAALGDWHRAIEIRRQTVRMATEWNSRGVMITQQVQLAEALHGAGERRALEKLVAEMMPDVERYGLRGIARELRSML